MIIQNYVLKADDMNVEAKRERFRAAICKWIRGLAQALIAQHGINNYNEDVTVMDLIASAPEDILVPLGINLPKFLSCLQSGKPTTGGDPYSDS
jgi:hypothetical protein